MKKLFTIIGLLAIGLFVKAQNYAILHIEDIPAGQGNEYHYCANEYDGIEIYAQQGCPNFQWTVNYSTHYTNVDPLVLDNTEEYYFIHYSGCSNGRDFTIYFHGLDVQNPFAEPLVWKRQGESITLSADYYDYYEVLWSNGSTDYQIDVTEPGIYSVSFTSVYGCGTQTFSIEVRDNVELYRATVDLATNLNKVTWQTMPEQVGYISQVKVERDGMVVGTAPYEDGQFIDNIGSENAARNYRLTGIDTDGNECPIPSYQKGTLHVDYSPNASNPNKLNMAWTPPFIEEGAPISVSYFQICKYDPATGEVTVIDQIGANNTIGSYDVNLFDGGYATVAALFSEGKDYEDVAFSNLTDEVLGVDENAGNPVRVYPNPANGRFTVEGTGTMHITNALGQEIMAREIDGKETIVLPQGIYFVRLNGTVRKIVVE